MRIGIASDHGGYTLKTHVIKDLEAKGITVVDYGTDSETSVDYPDFAKKVATGVKEGAVDFGIAMCGTGIGISIAANKIKGIRAALVHDTNTARLAREHNNANIIALGGRTTTPDEAMDIIGAFMEARFESRHQTRLDKIDDLEKGDHGQ
jgi:ribose 5-phosphate isomerase B